MTNTDNENILVIFDRLNLEDPQERRLAVFALNDYYGAILTEIGEDALDLRKRDLEMGIKHQWSKVKSRIDELDNINIPPEYDRAIQSVGSIRGNIAHDFTEIPPDNILKESREIAPEWSEWVVKAADEYREHQVSLTAVEALVQVGRRTTEYIKEPPKRYPPEFSRRQESLNADANDLECKLASLETEEEVTRELVNVIQDILELERTKEALLEEYRQEIDGWRAVYNTMGVPPD